jgi:Putative Ig domain/Abnormal spindle-like microcephaly-assoc'd, ASPM-SPD-2-Hydin
MRKRLAAVLAVSSILFTAGLGFSAPAFAHGGGGSPTVTSLTADTATPAPSSSGTIKVQLSGAAPRGGSAVTLASSDTSALSVPASVTIGSGISSGSFSYTTGAVSSATAVTVTATLGSSSASATLTVTPAGTSGTPVTLTPASLTFASQAVGTTSAAQTITATNTGTGSLFFNNVATSGDELDFTIGTDDCIGTTLPAGASCTISVTFSPTVNGTRTADVVYTDNAPNSPQTVPITGTGTGGTAQPLAIDDQFFTCTGGVCDIGAGSNVFVSNFFSTSFEATGGTAPYTFSGQPPAGLTLRPSGLLLGAPAATGTSQFTVTVTDATGATATGTFSLTVTGPPSPSPRGCQTGGKLTEPLSGPSFNGQTPNGTAGANETQFSGCGGFSILSVGVKKVNLPNGTQVWVTIDGLPVGLITLKNGSGSMTPYNLGDFGVSMDQVQVFSSLPDVGTFQQILSGGTFS